MDGRGGGGGEGTVPPTPGAVEVPPGVLWQSKSLQVHLVPPGQGLFL